jgi:hypothetical protein
MLIKGSKYSLMAYLSDHINFDRKGGGNKADGSKNGYWCFKDSLK